jgi:deoxyribose-phosphate aldolase
MNPKTSDDAADGTEAAGTAREDGAPAVGAPRVRPAGGRPEGAPGDGADRAPGEGTGPGGVLERNPGVPLDLEWVRDARANRSAVERRAATLSARRSVKRDWQAAWLLRAVTFLDLTTLAGADTPGRVRRLCAKARRPVRDDLLEAMGMADRDLRVAAVCVYGSLVPTAVEALEGTGIPVASVAAGFPSGLGPFEERLDEVGRCREAGADEIDVVVTRGLVLRGEWRRLYDELRAFRDACGDAHLKVILGTGELGTLRNVARASRVAMMAGADFVKTSTGKESVNATLPVGLVMTRSVRAYRRRTGHRVGFKPAGGIRTAKDALRWLYLIKDELGDAWLDRRLFRFGASSLLADVERQLEHHVTGRYSAHHRHPMA